jgi:hypothetical protein
VFVLVIHIGRLWAESLFWCGINLPSWPKLNCGRLQMTLAVRADSSHLHPSA